MSEKKQTTPDKKQAAVGELHKVFKKHGIASAQVNFDDGTQSCWNGQDWVPC